MIDDKIIEIDGGYDIEKNGKHYARLYPEERRIEIKFSNIRIQNDSSQAIEPHLKGFAELRIASFKSFGEVTKDGKDIYYPAKTNYVMVSIGCRPDEQKYIAETNKEIGTMSSNLNMGDMSATLNLELTTKKYKEIYELIKTRQITSLEAEIRFKGGEENLFYREYYIKDMSMDKTKKDIHAFPKHPDSFAIKDWTFPSGEIDNIEFSTKPIELRGSSWGYRSVNKDSYDANFDSYEAYIKKENKTGSRLSNLSFFEICVVSFLGLMILLQFI